MFLEKKLEDGTSLIIRVREHTQERLLTTCFRPTSKPLAGNFLRWCSVGELFGDAHVMEIFMADLEGLWSQEEFGTSSLTITHSMPVGWESTASLQNYELGDLEEFDLNRRSWGLRVKRSRTDLFAPKTNELTIVFEFKSEDGKAVAIVHSIYPGIDIGELHGDVTEREGRIFFDWNHPGEV